MQSVHHSTALRRAGHSWSWRKLELGYIASASNSSRSSAVKNDYQENVNVNKSLFNVSIFSPQLTCEQTVKKLIIPIKKDLIQSLHTFMDEQRKLRSTFNFWIAHQVFRLCRKLFNSHIGKSGSDTFFSTPVRLRHKIQRPHGVPLQLFQNHKGDTLDPSKEQSDVSI